jgi:hypothetical protein
MPVAILVGGCSRPILWHWLSACPASDAVDYYIAMRIK